MENAPDQARTAFDAVLAAADYPVWVVTTAAGGTRAGCLRIDAVADLPPGPRGLKPSRVSCQPRGRLLSAAARSSTKLPSASATSSGSVLGSQWSAGTEQRHSRSTQRALP